MHDPQLGPCNNRCYFCYTLEFADTYICNARPNYSSYPGNKDQGNNFLNYGKSRNHKYYNLPRRPPQRKESADEKRARGIPERLIRRNARRAPPYLRGERDRAAEAVEKLQQEIEAAAEGPARAAACPLGTLTRKEIAGRLAAN